MNQHIHHCHHHNVYHEHDHNPATRMAEAKAHCLERGVRFTPLREQVFELILEADKPMGAYDLISALQVKRQDDPIKSGKNIAPPTVYRSLEFLLDEGLIHQLSSINAYVPCCHPRSQHAAAFLICNRCQKVEECSNPPVQSILDFATNDANFAVERTVIELKGICRDCQAH
ncbi:Fur family transcriptional regulator [Moraxella sp.]|uniref:Fur family transcriptional regulator n=1 Tax=Moraxella sp. TaxID=479 RepID=UPI0026DB8F76|nr:Fur family transcriptional regulator [Moraxella sp.]MDO4894944.1 Fur family transcriptional regulator [Moraxella sp.]